MLARALAVLSLASRDCGDEPRDAQKTPPAQQTPAGGGLISSQSFGSWRCAADAPPTFAFDLVQQEPKTGTHHQWVDADTRAGLPATVDLARVYVMKDGSTPFPNFD